MSSCTAQRPRWSVRSRAGARGMRRRARVGRMGCGGVRVSPAAPLTALYGRAAVVAGHRSSQTGSKHVRAGAAVSLWTEGRHRCGDPQPVRTCQGSHNARCQWQPTVLHDHQRRTQQPPGDICRAHIAAALASTLDVSAITAYCLSTLNRTMCRNGSVRDVGRHGAAIAMQRCRPRHRRDASDRCISSMTVTSARWAVIAGRWSAAHVQA